MEKGGSVYILTNKSRTVFYVGVTSNLPLRIYQHRIKFYPGSFTARYNVNQLVYYESFFSIVEAISREKQLKAGSRAKKIKLINNFNPEWLDLYDQIADW